MPRYWMITNRNVKKDGLGSDRSSLSFWISDGGDASKWETWKKVSSGAAFQKLLTGAAGELRLVDDPGRNEEQQHVTLFIHGYNNTWDDAAARYQSLCAKLFEGNDSMGICVLFNWPSDGMPVNYLPDREDARKTAPDLASILSSLYDWLLTQQERAALDDKNACRAKTSIIAHSMGNYVLQNAMQLAWTRKNQPILVSLVNQLLLVAADVDNDLFGNGETQGKSDGDAIANLSYRVTALYTGLDGVLGLSSGLKHFGKRRLGRSGLDRTLPCPDNVWDVDCTKLFKQGQQEIHSAYFEEPKTLQLMRDLLKGTDRKVLMARDEYKGLRNG